MIFPKEKKADEERIRNSEEYKEECRKLDLEYDRKQEELDHKFRDRMENFQKSIYPGRRNTTGGRRKEKVRSVKYKKKYLFLNLSGTDFMIN